jgi:heptosyltransferase II
MSAVTGTVPLPFGHGKLNLGEQWQLSRTLRGRYGEAIVLPNSLKSALLPWLSGIARRTGYLGEHRYGLLNDRRDLDRAAVPRMVDQFLALADPAGVPLRSAPAPRLVVDADRAMATAQRLALRADGRAVVFCPGAEYGPAKRWPVAHFADLARQLHAQGHPIWLMGSTNDMNITQAIASDSGVPCHDLAGKTTLAEAIDLLSLAHSVVANDSGLMHAAAALDRPMAAIFGSSSPAFTPPLSSVARVASIALECSPCFARQCPLGHLRCLNELTPAAVEHARQEAIKAAERVNFANR